MCAPGKLDVNKCHNFKNTMHHELLENMSGPKLAIRMSSNFNFSNRNTAKVGYNEVVSTGSTVSLYEL